MGKASKWIRNFLLRKKEEKDKKKDTIALSAETLAIPSAILLETPKEKRRWSFRKSAIVDATPHKRTRSFDSIVATQLLTQALLVYENGQNHATATVVAPNEAAKIAVAATRAPASKPGPVQDAAATKIQAFYRSYLARKALCALKGLVKLQALVRGHLVRKQTTAMLRRVNALMTIQVRARVQRIHMAEESQPVVKRRTTHRKIILDNQLRRTSSERKDVNINETRGSLKSQKGHINSPQTETIEHGSSTYNSGSLSISKREHQFQIYPNSSPLTDMFDRQFEELSFNMAQRSSQTYSTVPKFNRTVPGSEYADPMSHDYQFEPNYMARTESSRAKVRSQSEPKQRPKWSMKQKSRRIASVEGMNNMTQCSSSHTRDNAQQKQHPWLIKLYRSTKHIKDINPL